MAFFDKLLGRKPCPNCGNPVGNVSGGKLCHRCDTYLIKSGEQLVPMPVNSVAKSLSFGFGAPLPWPDVRAVQEGTVLELSAISAIQQMITTKNEGVRLLDAQWPRVCCVCGKAAQRFETIAAQITIPRFKGPINVGDQKVKLVAQGAPHCSAHSGGVAFGRIKSVASVLDHPYGLLFLSLAYRNEFRRLNPWGWVLG